MLSGDPLLPKFGTVSLIGVDGEHFDKIPMGSTINRGPTFHMARTPVQHYLHYLPKFLTSKSARSTPSLGSPIEPAGALQEISRPKRRRYRGCHEALGCWGPR